MPTPQQLIAESREKWMKDFEDQYGLEDPSRTFRDHDDFLIIRNNFMSWYTSNLISLLDALIEDYRYITPKYHYDHDLSERDVELQNEYVRGAKVYIEEIVSRLETLKSNIAKTAE